MEKLEVCTEFIQLCEETDQKLRNSVEIVESETNYHAGDGSETTIAYNYPVENIKNQALSKTWSSALKQKCAEKFEIHSNNANEKQEKIKEKYQCAICGKLMASG